MLYCDSDIEFFYNGYGILLPLAGSMQEDYLIDKQEQLIDAIIAQRSNRVAEFLSEGVDPNRSLDADNVTPLHFAVQQCDIEIVKLLLEAGADCRAKTVDGQTPWDVAVLHGHLPIVGLLKEYLCQVG